MDFYSKDASYALAKFNSSAKGGLSSVWVSKNLNAYGENKLTKSKKKSFVKRLVEGLKEPMLIILIFSLIIAFGTKLGSFLKTGESDFAECLGILGAIVLSVSITLIMEGSSERAFSMLESIYDNLTVRVIRDNQVIVVQQRLITVGDVIILESGDKIVADGRLIQSQSLKIDESSLTGESQAVDKDANIILDKGAPLAERKNCVYSGTFVSSGSGQMVVTAVGDNTEIGKIAGELINKSSADSPLSKKLSRLGKTISIIGTVSAIFVFILSLVRLILTSSVTFDSVQELFISCIILIVAAVPEGLPTIVAVSLALNMIKLAKENALIKKMVATETAGAVSVICSDKTGTLTKNKMTVVGFVSGGVNKKPNKITQEHILQNFICNSTVDVIVKGKNVEYVGSGTEGALVAAVMNNISVSYQQYRDVFDPRFRLPFSSENKFMITAIKPSEEYRYLMKGSAEKVLYACNLTDSQRKSILSEMKKYEDNAERILCFAHYDGKEFIDNADKVLGELEGKYVFDGYAVLKDPVRKEVKEAVRECKSAGIKVKILTGDNRVTAFAIARELDIANSDSQVVNASEIEKLSDEELNKVLPKITVIARSTPLVKLRVVKALKSLDEVVAVTGDGINDAPALKQADIGIAMGLSGSEIAKESADVILLDDSFATVVRAIYFGRSVYRNLQRFILFQLSVNLSALIFITTVAVLGIKTPFNTFQLLWINVIMDGPPALTLGLEKMDKKVMNFKPVKRNESIVSGKMLMKILFNGVFIGGVMLLQFFTNFLNASALEKGSATFTLFILFQLFNAFNSRELGKDSIFDGIGKNRIMVITFGAVFLIHAFIVQVCYKIFGIMPMSFTLWVRCIVTASSIVLVSEIYKLCYRLFRKFSDKENKKVYVEKMATEN